MQYKWINKTNNKNLIVFFNGWGMDEKIVSHLDCTNFDVLIFYDYRNFSSIEFDFSQYETKTLVAWSLGVYVCNLFYDVFRNFDKFIALNGTQKPIDDSYGIPSKIYNLTTDNFNELSCKKFMRKISDSTDIHSYCSRTSQELKLELESIRDLSVENFLKFDKSYISANDKIIPSKNQINYWTTTNAKVIEIEGMHYIFELFNSWEEIL